MADPAATAEDPSAARRSAVQRFLMPSERPGPLHGHLLHGVWSGMRWWLDVSGDPAGPVLHSRRFLADPVGVYADLRDGGPVRRSRLPGLSITTTHAAAETALRDHHVGPPPDAAVGQPLLWDSPLSPSLLDLDPPDHTRIRRLVAQAFTPRAIAHLRAEAEAVVDELLDAAAAAERVDLVAALAGPLPVRMICAMLGVPADQQDRFTRWGEALALSLEPSRSPAEQRAIDAAGTELRAFFAEEFARRRAAGDPGEDVLGRLLAAREGADRLDDRELTATCTLLLGAGFETTVNLIASGVLHLLRAPEQLALLIEDPDLIPGAVEELLRIDAPVQLTGRVVWEDSEIAGVEVPAGTNLMVLLGAANHDPAVFPDPDRLDVTRPNAKANLAFSSGIHHCLGAPLARLEAEVALRALVTRFPAIRQVAPARRRTTRVLRGLQTLPVSLAGAPGTAPGVRSA